MNHLGLAFVYELELAVREAREQRLRKRIDELLERVDAREQEKYLLLRMLKAEKDETKYLGRRVQTLIQQRDFWKRKAQEKESHEMALIKKKTPAYRRH